MAGVANPRLEAERQAKALADAKAKKELVAQQARRAMAATSGSTKSSSIKKRPSSAVMSSTAKLSGSSSTASFVPTSSPPSRHPNAPPQIIPALPPCTCTNPACREEFRLLYATLSSHLESQAHVQQLQAELRKENALLRKQLQLYRIEGVARAYHETPMGGGANAILNDAILNRSASLSNSHHQRTPSTGSSGATASNLLQRPPSLAVGGGGGSSSNLHRSTSAVLSPSASLARMNLNGTSTTPDDDTAGAARRRRERELERDRRLDDVRKSTLDRPSSSSTLDRPSSLRPSLYTDAAEDAEPRFQVPLSLDSPSNRLLRPFGGAGSERVDLNGSGSIVTGALSRQASAKEIARARQQAMSDHDADRGERDDLVVDLNRSPMPPSSLDRRPSGASGGGGGGGGEHLGATQEFSIGYA